MLGTRPPSVGSITAMLKASPHRGRCHETLVRGAAALGISFFTDRRDSWIAEDAGLVVAVAGKIDNLSELTGGEADLRSSAAVVIARAFRAHGDRLPNRLRGSYAVAISDGETLWCFRDHLGFSPLFYRNGGETFFAATEAKQVVAGAGIVAAPDLDVVERIFYGDVDDETPSAIRGVMRLPKATLLRVTMSGQRRLRYWHPEALLERGRMRPDEVRPRFVELMKQAAARTVAGDDIVALSGGVDSPAVAAFAVPVHQELTGQRLPALSTVYPQSPSVDERTYTELVAGRLGMELHVFEPSARPLDDLAMWVGLTDGPFPTTSLAEAAEFYGRARSLGRRTILTGELAEFLIDMDSDLVAHLLWRGRIGSVIRYLLAERSRGARPRRVARLIATAIAPDPAFRLYRWVRGSRPVGRTVSWIEIPDRSASRPHIPGRDRWTAWQTKAFVGPGISGEADEICQAVAGVSVRRPWADIDLWEFFLGLPAQAKFPNGRRKGLVRQLLRGWVPDEILDRRSKTYFDDEIRRRIDYAALRRWLIDQPYRMRGVNYGLLAEQLGQERLDLTEFIWARDLAAAHAFIAQF